jgi:hypothetical protein
MSVTQGISAVEIGFSLAAVLLSVVAGFVLVPVLRKALNEGAQQDSDRRGGE